MPLCDATNISLTSFGARASQDLSRLVAQLLITVIADNNPNAAMKLLWLLLLEKNLMLCNIFIGNSAEVICGGPKPKRAKEEGHDKSLFLLCAADPCCHCVGFFIEWQDFSDYSKYQAAISNFQHHF